MLEITLGLFLLSFSIELIHFISMTTITSAFFNLYSSIFNLTLSKQIDRLKTDIYSTKQQISQASAQDEFAKWARIQRKSDAFSKELEKLTQKQNMNRLSFQFKVQIALRIVCVAVPLVYLLMHRADTAFLVEEWMMPLSWRGKEVGVVLGFFIFKRFWQATFRLIKRDV